LVTDTGNATTNDAEAVFPIPPFEEVTAPDTLFFVPAPTPFTLTVTVQDPNGGIEPLASDTLVAAADALPPQPFDNPLGVFTTNPAGRLSLNPTPLSVVATFGLLSVNVNVDVPFTATTMGANPFPITGAATTTKLADAVFPDPPSVAATGPDTATLVPASVPRTLTVSVHDPEAGIVPPASEIDELLSTAVGTPPHELASPFGDATTRPAGRFCVNPTPDRPVSEFGFDTVNSSAVVAPSGIDDTPNALAIVGGRPTTIDALAVPPEPPSSEATAPVVLSF